MTEADGPGDGWYPERDPGVWAAWNAGRDTGRQAVFADLQAAYNRAHDVGYGADTEHRAETHAIMNGPETGPGHDAHRHAVIDGFNAGSLARKQSVAEHLDRDTARRMAAKQAHLEEPDTAGSKPGPVTRSDPGREARWETWAASRRTGRQAQPEREAEPG